MASKLALDPRIDPRIKAVFGDFELPKPTSVASREEILAEEGSEAAAPGPEPRVSRLFSMPWIRKRLRRPVWAKRPHRTVPYPRPTAIPSTSSSSAQRTTRSCHASTIFTVAAWRRCPVITVITVPGAG